MQTTIDFLADEIRRGISTPADLAARILAYGEMTPQTFASVIERERIQASEDAGAERMFTVFCVDPDDPNGTTHISAHAAKDEDVAASLGINETAEDWGYSPAAISVLGVAEGDVRIIIWND